MIINHPTLRFIQDRWPYEEACKVVQCDFCRTRADHKANRVSSGVGNTIEDAVEQAQRVGFKRIRGAKLSDPMKWSCGCQP